MTTREEAFSSNSGTTVDLIRHVNGSKTVVFWFSAFTTGPHLGRVLRVSPKFHGYKLSKSTTDFDWVLIRDGYGLTSDGTYYGGRSGDLFVEDAVSELISKITQEYLSRDSDTKFVAMGSSMGAYGALKFGILNSMPVFCWSPHLDMEIAMKFCGRGPWIRSCLTGSGNTSDNEYLNRLQELMESASSLPPVIMQTNADDDYVYPEQVEPFVAKYRSLGGSVVLDVRESGGHSARNTQDEYILSALGSLANGTPFEFASLLDLSPRPIGGRERFEMLLQSMETGTFRTLQRLGLKH